MIAYTVTCTFLNEALAEEWIAWLEDEHLAEVIEAGAVDAEVVRLDGNQVRCEARYHFPSREVFNVYEREHAPRLRAAGLEKFPLDRGMSYLRGVGEVVVTKKKPKPKPAPRAASGAAKKTSKTAKTAKTTKTTTKKKTSKKS